LTDSVKTFISYLTQIVDFPAPILEMGSKPAPQQEGYADLRPLFGSKPYTGCDMKAGEGVDSVQDVQAMTFEDEQFQSVVCLETIEHVENPFRAMSEMFRVLTTPGLLVISTQMWFPVHFYIDYWRFTPMCMRDVLLKSFERKEVYLQGDPNFPHSIIGLGYKGEQPTLPIHLKELNNSLPCPYPFPFQKYH